MSHPELQGKTLFQSPKKGTETNSSAVKGACTSQPRPPPRLKPEKENAKRGGAGVSEGGDRRVRTSSQAARLMQSSHSTLMEVRIMKGSVFQDKDSAASTFTHFAISSTLGVQAQRSRKRGCRTTSFIYWCCREKEHGVHQGGQGQDQSRPFPPRGFCLGRSSRSWRWRRRGAQACRFSCSSSLEDRVHGRWPPSRASQRRDRDWRGSLVTHGLSSFLGSLLSFSFFSFSPFFDFSLGLSWDPRPPRGAHSFPEASGVDPPSSPRVSASVASGLSSFCTWGPGGLGVSSGGPDGGTKSGVLGCGKTCGVLGSAPISPQARPPFPWEAAPSGEGPGRKLTAGASGFLGGGLGGTHC